MRFLDLILMLILLAALLAGMIFADKRVPAVQPIPCSEVE